MSRSDLNTATHETWSEFLNLCIACARSEMAPIALRTTRTGDVVIAQHARVSFLRSVAPVDALCRLFASTTDAAGVASVEYRMARLLMGSVEADPDTLALCDAVAFVASEARSPPSLPLIGSLIVY